MKYILIILVVIYTISCQETEQQRLERLIDKYQGLIDKYHKRLAEINNTDTIKIGSWNIQNLSMNRATDKITFNGRSVEVTEAIADIIKKENFDAIAIQEIEGDNIGAIERVIQYLNKEKQIYRTTYPAKMGRSDSKAEFLPIIYNSEKLKLKSSGMLKDLWMQRSPHYAQFSVRNNMFVDAEANKDYFDFVLVSVHIAPKMSGDDDLPRQDDFYVLPRVFRMLQKQLGEPDIIVGGDYNCDPTSGSRSIDFRLWESVKSNSISVHDFKKNGQIQDDSMIHGQRLNDNIVWSESSDEDWAGTKQVIDIVEDYCGGDTALGKKISDHLPVFAVFKTSRDSE